MRPATKFALLAGMSGLLGFGICVLLSLALRKANLTSLLLLLGDVFFAASIISSAYLASKRHWLADDIPLSRAAMATLPLLLLPASFLIAFIGWGDPQEHWIRGILHSAHRVLPQGMVGKLVLGMTISFAALLAAALVWVSVSILTKSYRAQSLILFSASLLLLGLCSSFVIDVAVRSNVAGVVFGILFFFGFGVLFAVAVSVNHLRLIRLAVLVVGILSAFLVAQAFHLVAKSPPEIQLPETTAPPLWTLDIASAGCTPSYGGPSSYSAPGEVSFATNEILGMSVQGNAVPTPAGGWKYESCLLSINAKTGMAIAHKPLPLSQPSIAGQSDGSFCVDDQYSRKLFSTNLDEIADSKSTPEAHRAGETTGLVPSELLKHFHMQSDGTLLYENGGKPRRIAHWGGSKPRQLSDDRVLFTAGTQFLVFDGQGNLVGSQEFVRPRVNFAALSRDHRRFALAVYVWGFGDPSYLEEETIAVYDVDSLRPVFAVRSVPLPKEQSWAALSPDGSLLAVGAEHTLRLFRLPLN